MEEYARAEPQTEEMLDEGEKTKQNKTWESDINLARDFTFWICRYLVPQILLQIWIERFVSFH